MPMRIKNGKTLVVCCKCENCGVMIKTDDRDVAEERLRQRCWRRDYTDANEWVCPKCDRGENRGPRGPSFPPGARVVAHRTGDVTEFETEEATC